VINIPLIKKYSTKVIIVLTEYNVYCTIYNMHSLKAIDFFKQFIYFPNILEENHFTYVP